jgi:L-alanine-DL-glutamate epimerase-like enolase superfamily enzyme
VKVETDEGITGIGESACFGGPPFSTANMIEKELAKHILGEDPTEITRLGQKMWYGSRMHGRAGLTAAAMSGIDVALWDILGKKAKMPLFRLMGAYKDRLTPYASSGFYQNGKGTEELVKEVEGYVEEGFRYVKIKCARTPNAFLSPTKEMPFPDYCNYSMEEDLARVEACAKAIKGKARLMVDGNCAWTPFDAIQMGRQFEKLNVYWFEEPVATDDIDGSAKVADALDMPISGYETQTNMFSYRDIIQKRAVDIVQPDCIWSGGFSAARKIAIMAELYHMPVVPHVFATGVCLAANMHLIASIPNGHILELDRNPFPLRDELLAEPFEIKDNVIKLPERPGLGIELDENTVKKYQIFEK